MDKKVNIVKAVFWILFFYFSNSVINLRRMVILDILHVELSQPAISQPSLLGSNGHPSDTNDDERSSTIVVVPQQSPNEM